MTRTKIIWSGLILLLLLGGGWGIQAFLAQRRLAHYQQPPSPFPLALQWQVTLGQAHHDIPRYQDGILILPADTRMGVHWYGVQASNGEIVWSRWTTNLLDRFGLRKYHRCLFKDYLLIGGQNALLALNPADGSLWWQEDKASQGSCSQYTAFVSGCPRCGLSAYRLATEKRLWGGASHFVGPNPWGRTGVILSDQFYNPVNDTILGIAVGGEPKGYFTANPQTGNIITYLGDVKLSPAIQGRSTLGHSNSVD